MAVIEYTQGNILDAEAEALVNTVNCVGAMGRGIALQFKNAFPANYKAYAAACERGDVQPGRMFVYDTGQFSPHWIINFPTKRHWRGKSRMEDIVAGLRALVAEIDDRGIRSIAIPPLGSGLGGLAWPDVRPMIEEALSEVPDVQVTLFEPSPVASKERGGRKSPPKMTPGRAALVSLISRYRAGMMDPWISLLEIHKLLYFQQVAGEPLRLRYAKGHYGPYAENLRHVLRDIEGYYTTGYTGEGDDPAEQIELMPGALEKADGYLASNPDTHGRFDRVSDLVEGFETPFGLELLATAHWVAVAEGAKTDDAIITGFRTWNARKAQFTDNQIRIAAQRLRDAGWLAT